MKPEPLIELVPYNAERFQIYIDQITNLIEEFAINLDIATPLPSDGDEVSNSSYPRSIQALYLHIADGLQLQLKPGLGAIDMAKSVFDNLVSETAVIVAYATIQQTINQETALKRLEDCIDEYTTSTRIERPTSFTQTTYLQPANLNWLTPIQAAACNATGTDPQQLIAGRVRASRVAQGSSIR